MKTLIEQAHEWAQSPFARAAACQLPQTNPERYAYLIGLLDRHTLKLAFPHRFRWTSCGGDESKRRAYLVGFGREFRRTPLPLP